ncbi:hypothetical protein V5T82_16650 [Magnetovibrio sp. PR-2]|uniref:hypothetical protein n=1 Tax=Magnetovibrio sp. PR-2 TaxID=3120356 RepID=UPI002FCE0930
MAFATVLAVIAFFVAMVALWLTSDIVKKVQSQNDQFIRSQVTGLREQLRELDAVVSKTYRASQRQDNVQAGLEQRLNDHTKVMGAMKAQISTLTTQLDDLDRSVPSRYRVRIAKSDAKETDKSASKPSIQ